MLPQKVTLRGTKWDEATRILQQWVDSVQVLLSGRVTLGAQFSGLITTTWNSARQTPIRLKSLTRPVAVLCLNATTGNGENISGVPITWVWAASDGSASLTITAANGLASSTDYTLVLFPVEA